MFEYDHSFLSLVDLQKKGIRSTRDLEEVIEWKYSGCKVDDVSLQFPIYIIAGLTEKCRGLTVAVMVNENGLFRTLDAIIPARDDLFVAISKKP
jgi:hypothetical protein